MSEIKRLATILSLDVAGYSRAAEKDDVAAAAAVRQVRAAIEEIVAPQGGRIFNTAGDGFMLEFPSASSGVQAAIALLKEAAARQLPKMRIGLHLGDVIVEPNGDLLGHGVNVAARLQALAAPGAAMVSESVRSQVRASADIRFAPQGRVQLDKMSERVAVYALDPTGAAGLNKIARRRLLRNGLGAAAAVTGLGAGLAWYAYGPRLGAKPRIAVLKFQNIGATEPFFAEGMTDELTSELARIQGLDVVARASSFALDLADATPAGAAKKLNANLILSGSIRKTDGAVRVQTQLVEAPGGSQIWAEGFEKPAADVFALQRDIAVKVARRIDVRTAGVPAASIDPRAYDLYLEARTRNMAATKEEQFEAIRDLYRAAIVLQPDFARAWGGLAAVEADHMFGQCFFNGVMPTREGLKPAFDAIEKALALDPSDPQNYESKGCAHTTLGAWKEAMEAYELAAARGGLGGAQLFYNMMGFGADAVAAAREAARRDPLSLRNWTNLAIICANVGDRDGQLEAMSRARDLGPDDAIVNGFGYLTYIANHDLASARKLRNEHATQIDGFLQMNAPFDTRYFRYLAGDGPPPPASEIVHAVETDAGYPDTSTEMLVNIHDYAAAARMLDRWGPTTRPALAYLYRADWAPLRQRGEFWRLLEREGLLSFWRDASRWPDFCASDTICDVHK